MGPAVTSEAGCEREKRLRTTASLSPHNTQSDPPSTSMNPEESDFVEAVGNLCSSSPPNESTSTSVSSATDSNSLASCARAGLLKSDGVLCTSQDSYQPNNVNFLNLKDIQGCPKASIFLKNNTCTMLPNSGTSSPSLPATSDDTEAIQVTECDEAVPSGTLALPSMPAKQKNSPKTAHHLIIIPTKSLNGTEPGMSVHSRIESTETGGVDNQAEALGAVDATGNEHAPLETTAFLANIANRQKSLCERTKHLLKRLRRLQCREVNSAIKEKLGCLVTSLSHVVGSKSSSAVNSKHVMKEQLEKRELSTLSTAELVSYVQKFQSSHQQGLSLHSAIGDRSSATESAEIAWVLNERMRSSLRDTSRQLVSNLRHLKSGMDSDATESSSGEESSEEMSALPEVSDLATSLQKMKKLEWEWVSGRADVVAQWTWIQAQVSDLEFRIRQLNDVYKQLRMSKETVSLHDPGRSSDTPGNLNDRVRMNRLNPVEDASSVSRRNSSLPDMRLTLNAVSESTDNDGSRSRLCVNTSSRTAEHLPEDRVKNSDSSTIHRESRVPESVASLPSPVTTSQQSSRSGSTNTSSLPAGQEPCATQSTPGLPPSTSDPTCRAARCMEVRGWRRRTLLRTSGLHELNRKAASQLSMVRCACYPPVTPCVLCGGRFDRVVRPGSVSTRDRITLLDPSYHSVLSYPHDLPLPLRVAESLWKGPSKSDTDGRHRLLDESSTRHGFRSVSVRIKNRVNSRSHLSDKDALEDGATDARVVSHPRPSIAGHGQKSNLHTIETMRKKKHLSLARKHLSKTALRASSSLKSNRTQMLRRGYQKDAALRRQSSRTTFDINNVVIPSHVTSAARVDIIQYKEIITPKWREILKDGETSTGSWCASAVPESSTAAKRPRLSIGDGDCTRKVHWSCKEPEPSLKSSFPSADPSVHETDAEDELENLSDEAYVARHLRYEIYEKKQCMPKSIGQQRRSRSNRSESDSFTLLNPQSPDNTNQLDASSSTMSGGPSAFCLEYSDVEDPAHHHGDGLLARQQSDLKLTRNFAVVSLVANLSTSQSSEQLADYSDRYAPSWPPRTFPLGDVENEQLFVEHRTDGVSPGGTRIVASHSPAASGHASLGSDSPLPSEDRYDPKLTLASLQKSKPSLLMFSPAKD